MQDLSSTTCVTRLAIGPVRRIGMHGYTAYLSWKVAEEALASILQAFGVGNEDYTDNLCGQFVFGHPQYKRLAEGCRPQVGGDDRGRKRDISPGLEWSCLPASFASASS